MWCDECDGESLVNRFIQTNRELEINAGIESWYLTKIDHV